MGPLLGRQCFYQKGKTNLGELFVSAAMGNNDFLHFFPEVSGVQAKPNQAGDMVRREMACILERSTFHWVLC